jgi:homoserine dehydrogenase
VRESFNAVFVQGGAVGDLMFYGRGAGGEPTASAVLGDLVDAAVNLHRGAHASVGKLAPARMRPPEESSSAVYLSLEAADRPGVLAAVASVFGDHGVSIASMEQESPSGAGTPGEGRALLEFVTHSARERDVLATIDDLRELDAVHRLGSVIRVLDAEEG